MVEFHSCSVHSPQDIGWVKIDVRDLHEGVENPNKIVPKLLIGAFVLRSNINLHVNCVGGITRSPSILAGILVIAGFANSFEEGLKIVKMKDINANPTNIDFINSVKKAIILTKNQMLIGSS